jgi:hypothetical protein
MSLEEWQESVQATNVKHRDQPWAREHPYRPPAKEINLSIDINFMGKIGTN